MRPLTLSTNLNPLQYAEKKGTSMILCFSLKVSVPVEMNILGSRRGALDFGNAPQIKKY
jgi:hypothetical protein